MSSESEFMSRQGTVSVSADKLRDFLTDIRNFSRLVPEGRVAGWNAEADSCSFTIEPVGSVEIRLAESQSETNVLYQGEVAGSIPFRLLTEIMEAEGNLSLVRLQLKAELNPFYKMVAGNAISRFLEKMIEEMEAFSRWDEIISPPPGDISNNT
jgi:carbon monoxide dehydrogenase subunit G